MVSRERHCGVAPVHHDNAQTARWCLEGVKRATSPSCRVVWRACRIGVCTHAQMRVRTMRDQHRKQQTRGAPEQSIPQNSCSARSGNVQRDVTYERLNPGFLTHAVLFDVMPNRIPRHQLGKASHRVVVNRVVVPRARLNIRHMRHICVGWWSPASPYPLLSTFVVGFRA